MIQLDTISIQAALWVLAGIFWIAALCAISERVALISLVLGFVLWLMGFLLDVL